VRILLTDGAGFIGSHVAEHLMGGGHEVGEVDNLSTEESITWRLGLQQHTTVQAGTGAAANWLARRLPHLTCPKMPLIGSPIR
jgi:nucleoside-diphosphate-sugar epimerase